MTFCDKWSKYELSMIFKAFFRDGFEKQSHSGSGAPWAALPFLSISIYFLSKLINKRSTIVQAHLSTLSSSTQEFLAEFRLPKPML